MIFLLVLLIGLPALYDARDCTVNNGDCAHYCIDRDDGIDATCACDCYYELDVDQQSCSPINDCDVDMLFVYDFSKGVDENCLLIALPSMVFNAFGTWRDEIAPYITAFSSEIASGSFRIGTMVSGGSLTVTNNYGAITDVNTLQTQVSGTTATLGQICGSENVFRGLYFTTDTVASPDRPENAGDGTTTTRVAVVTMVTPVAGSEPELTNLLNSYTGAIHDYYDQIFVVGRKDVNQLLSASDKASIDGQLRLLACQNSTSTQCVYLFYADDTNDDGLVFERNTVLNMIDRGACIARKPVNEHSATCGDDSATVVVPMCLLGGLTLADIHLNDAACTGTTHAVEADGSATFTIPYDSCSWTISTNTVDGVDHLSYSQTIVTMDFGAGGSAKSINLETVCTFVRYTDEQLGKFNPSSSEISLTVEENGNFDFSLTLYEDSSYTTPYGSSDYPLPVNVLDTMHFATGATLPSNLKVILTDVTVSSSTDKNSDPSHTILSGQCANDELFQILGSSTNSEVRFTLPMLEFTSTANEPDASKLPVYLHVRLFTCDASDATPECTQSCSARRKRSAVDDKLTRSKIIGPFYPVKAERNNTETLPEADTEERPGKVVVFISSAHSGFTYICGLLPILAATLVLLLGALIIGRKSLARRAERSDSCKALNGLRGESSDATKS